MEYRKNRQHQKTAVTMPTVVMTGMKVAVPKKKKRLLESEEDNSSLRSATVAVSSGSQLLSGGIE